MACDFCEKDNGISTHIGDYALKLSLDDEFKYVLKIRLEVGCCGLTKAIQIKFCPFCGNELI